MFHPQSAIGKPQCPRRGFALFELIVVMAILAVVGAMAAPRFANLGRRQRLEAASRRLMADLRLARSQAIRDQADRKLVFTTAAHTYSLPEYTGPGAPYSVRLNEASYKGVRLLSVSYSPAEVVFKRLGTPQSGGTVVLGDGVEQAVISISAATGRTTRTLQPGP